MKSRAVELAHRLLGQDLFSVDDLARELVITAAEMRECLDGTRELSLDRQLCLAALMIERVPRFARDGYALRGQVNAAIAFKAHATKVHNEPPGSQSTQRRSRTR